MTEILCRWLNEDVRLSQPITPETFASDFSNGYLLGELLNKHGLQDDFGQFSQNNVSNSKLNNFMRLEPTINLLGIPFNTNLAREIMQEKHSSISQLVYQMYIALTNKSKRNLTGTTIESMRPAAPVRLEQFESKIYQNNLKSKTPRQTDLNLEMLRARYDKFKIEKQQRAFEHKFMEEENAKNETQKRRLQLINKSKEIRQQKAELIAKIKAAVVQIPKTPTKFTKEAILERKKMFEIVEGEKALKQIDLFEKRFKSQNKGSVNNDLTIVDLEESRGFDDMNESQNQLDPINFVNPSSNEEYILKIRNRLQEDSHARKEREKRRRKVLVDQLKANEALEEFKREDALISHLMRQSQFEKRLAVELLHTRHEKDVFRKNRIANEQEVLARREKEFQEALDKERELARMAKLDYLDQARKDKELHDLIAADRAEAKYKKHYELCYDVMLQIFDFSYKVAEYRELTDNFIPPKVWRDWVSMFRAGKPLDHEEKDLTNLKDLDIIFNADTATMDDETHQILDEYDFKEYKNMIGEWEPPNKPSSAEIVVNENKLVGHIVKRLQDIVYPMPPSEPLPVFPPFPIKIALLGKPFAGKTLALKALQDISGIQVLYPDELIQEAIEEYKSNPDLTPPGKSESDEVNLNEDGTLAETASPSNDPTSSAAKPLSKVTKSSVPTPGPTVEINNTNPNETQNTELFEEHTDFYIRQLGYFALQSINKGEPVRDEIIVHILAEKIRGLSSETGWIIDGSPRTFNQAKLLEKALTGYDEDKPEPEKPKKESVLAPNPNPEPPKPKHQSGIDLVIYLDLDNETSLKRSIGRFVGTISKKEYQLAVNPPPEGAFTGINKQEIIDQVKDEANEMEHIQHKLTAFEDEWSLIKKFYENYGYVVSVDINQAEEGSLANEVQIQIDLFEAMRERKKEEELERLRLLEVLRLQKLQEEEELLAKKKQEEEEEAARKLAEEKEAAEKAAQEAAEKASAKGSKKGKRSKSPKSGKSPDKSVSPAKDKKSSSPKSKGKKSGKGSKASTPVPPPIVEEPPKEEEPQPGDENYVFIGEKVEDHMAKIVCDYWDTIETSYINGTKFVFKKIRVEREQIIRYFYTIKSNFLDYLRRPDTKQIELESFIKEYNSLSDDIRDDEEVKAELHQRVEDLKENLWKICDVKKLESEKEREIVMNNGWLPDKIGFMINHYISLVQAEVDRFQDTTKMLKDYYRSMQVPQPEEWTKDYPRLPLVDLRSPDELPNPENPESVPESKPVEAQPTQEPKASPRTKSPKSDRAKSPKSKSPTGGKKQSVVGATAAPAGAKGKGKKTPETDENGKKKIPLVPRRPSSQDGKETKKPKKPKNSEEVSPPPPEDLDEKLIFDACKTAFAHVNNIMSSEAALMAAEETSKDDAAAAAPEKDKKGKKSKSPAGKGKKEPPAKSKSPKGKKGGKKSAEPPPVAVQELSEEEKLKKALKEKMKKEYMATLKKEDMLFRMRVELVKQVANKVIQDLKNKADNTYKEMDDKLGERFLKEMDSIKMLCNFIKFSIENKQKIKRELVLMQDEFLIDDDVVVVRTPSPPPRPDAIEDIQIEYYTIDSLYRMLQQFKQVAPNGLIAAKSFSEIFHDLLMLNYDHETLPEQWSNLTQTQIDSLGKLLAANSEFIDWRQWLLAASAPFPFPTQSQLLELLQKYRSLTDLDTPKLIDRNAFNKIPLWFILEKPNTPPDISKPHSYDRHSHLINFWFDLFAFQMPSLPDLTGKTTITGPIVQKLDFKNMLFYLAAVSDPYDGFLRALSVSQEKLMPKLEPRIHMKAESFNTKEYEKLKVLSANSEHFPDDQLISIESVYRVLHHGERKHGDTHRFAHTEDPEGFNSYQRLLTVFNEINEGPGTVAPLSKLISHPVFCEMVSNCNKFRFPDFKTIFANQSNDDDFGNID